METNTFESSALFVIIGTYALTEFLMSRVLSGGLIERAALRQSIRTGIFHIIITVLLILPFITAGLVFFLLVFIVLNRVLDISLFTPPANEKRIFEKYILKQILMFVLLYTGWLFLHPFETHRWFRAIIHFAVETNEPVLQWIITHHVHILITLTGAAFVIDGGTQTVRSLLGKFPRLSKAAIASLRTDTYDHIDENSGEWIGILERILVFAFVLLQAYMAIAFVLTAKSIARFKELENKPFAEYYLIGTTASVLTAILSGLLVRALYSLF